MLKCADFTTRFADTCVGDGIVAFLRNERMNFLPRRMQLARITCFGVAAFIGSVHAIDALAQAPAPLRVDPVLLGLPPAKAVEKPVEKPPTPAPRSSAEAKPVEAAPVVEARSLDSEPKEAEKPATAKREVPRETPAPLATPERTQEIRPSAPPPPTPAASPSQRVEPPTKPPEKTAVPAAPAALKSPAPANSGTATQQASKGVAPLRVDPALLGLPPVAPTPETRLAAPEEGRSGTKTVSAPAVPAEPAARPVAASQPASAPTPIAAAIPGRSAEPKPGSLPPLRVDPALLGQPPLIAAMTPDPKTGKLPVIPDEEDSDDPSPALALRASGKMVKPPKDSPVPRPVFLSAYLMKGNVESEFIAEGNAELRKIGTVVEADRLTYWPIEDEVQAEGNVRMDLDEDVVTGPKMRMKLEDQVGYFEQPVYSLRRQPRPDSQAAADKAFAQNFLEQQNSKDFWNSGFAAPRTYDLKQGQTKLKEKTVATTTEARGQAERIDFEGENQVQLSQATYTTCAPGNDDWYIKLDKLRLDYDHEVGKGTDGTVYFKGMPIFYSPWLSFSLNNQRKSGFLPPSLSTSSDSGVGFSLPYYWNIAPNMDATITPHVMTRRGVQMKNEFRYLNTAWGGLYNSTVKAEFLPSDRLRDNENRYAYSLIHTQNTAHGFSGTINYNKVSDDHYFTDLSSEVSQTSQSHLLQEGVLNYGGSWWSASAKLQQHQTLQPDRDNPVLEPYKLLPQITVNARKPDFYLTDSSFMGQYTHFTRPTQTVGGTKISGKSADRTVLYPQIALPYVTPGWYVTPKIGVNIRRYSISDQSASTPDNINVSTPIFSVDSGMTFERSSNWFGKDYTQTLEPRLYYVNIPYKRQDDIPIFDSGLADFNFAQIFSENQFTGWDRINNANQLTAAATSRLLDPTSGNEIMRAMLGQRFYFTRNRVTLNSPDPRSEDRKWNKSDFLAAFSGQILPRLYADGAWQYNLPDRRLTRYSMGLSFRPEPGKVLNAAYRYNREITAPVNQIDVSGQWPLGGGWHGVGRLNYSFKDSGTQYSTGSQSGRLVEGLAGLEYNGGCWVVRGVVKRLALTEKNASTAFFIQLELSDFARLGSNPLELLKRSISGYRLINQPMTDDSF